MSQESLLVRMAKEGLDINLMKKNVSKVFLPILEIVEKSPEIAVNAENCWEYKSIGQMAVEDFCKDFKFYKGFKEDEILSRASYALSQNLTQWAWYHEQGLRLYVKDGASFRQATKNDTDYVFMIRLSKDEGFMDMRYTSPPEWAKNLYLNYRAYDVYSWFYHEKYTDFKYEFIKKIKSDAIENILDNDNDNFEKKTIFRKDLCSLSELALYYAYKNKCKIIEAVDFITTELTIKKPNIYSDFEGGLVQALEKIYDDKSIGKLYSFLNSQWWAKEPHRIDFRYSWNMLIEKKFAKKHFQLDEINDLDSVQFYYNMSHGYKEIESLVALIDPDAKKHFELEKNQAKATNTAKGDESIYSTNLLAIQNLVINNFFNPRKSVDAKQYEVIEWIIKTGKELNISISKNVASTMFTIIKPIDHNPKKKRAEL